MKNITYCPNCKYIITRSSKKVNNNRKKIFKKRKQNKKQYKTHIEKSEFIFEAKLRYLGCAQKNLWKSAKKVGRQ